MCVFVSYSNNWLVLFLDNLDNSIFIFGSESKGISLEVKEEIMKSITIPKSKTNQSIDSLNLASSVAVVLSEKLRQSR